MGGPLADFVHYWPRIGRSCPRLSTFGRVCLLFGKLGKFAPLRPPTQLWRAVIHYRFSSTAERLLFRSLQAAASARMLCSPGRPLCRPGLRNAPWLDASRDRIAKEQTTSNVIHRLRPFSIRCRQMQHRRPSAIAFPAPAPACVGRHSDTGPCNQSGTIGADC